MPVPDQIFHIGILRFMERSLNVEASLFLASKTTTQPNKELPEEQTNKFSAFSHR